MHDLYKAYHIAIVGTGRVGRPLDRVLSGLGYHISGVSYRTLAVAAQAARFIGSVKPVVHADVPQLMIPSERTVLCVATPDDARATAESLADHLTAWYVKGALPLLLLTNISQLLQR